MDDVNQIAPNIRGRSKVIQPPSLNNPKTQSPYQYVNHDTGGGGRSLFATHKTLIICVSFVVIILIITVAYTLSTNKESITPRYNQHQRHQSPPDMYHHPRPQQNTSTSTSTSANDTDDYVDMSSSSKFNAVVDKPRLAKPQTVEPQTVEPQTVEPQAVESSDDEDERLSEMDAMFNSVKMSTQRVTFSDQVVHVPKYVKDEARTSEDENVKKLLDGDVTIYDVKELIKTHTGGKFKKWISTKKLREQMSNAD